MDNTNPSKSIKTILISSLCLIITLLMFIFLTSCDVLFNKQQYCEEIKHEPPPDARLKLLWEKSDLYVFPDDIRPMIVGMPNTIIVQAKVGQSFDFNIMSFNSLSGDMNWDETINMPSPIITDNQILVHGQYNKINIYQSELNTQPKILSFSNIGDLMYYSLNKDYLYGYTNGGKFLTLNTIDYGNDIIDVGFSFFPVRVENQILFALEPYKIMAVDKVSNITLWKTDIAEPFMNPTFTGEQIFISTGDFSRPGKIFAINKADGKINWMKYTKIISNLAVFGEDIYFLDENGYLVKLDKKDGNEVARYLISTQPFLLRQVDNFVGGYFIGVDDSNNVAVISLGDSCQVFALKLP